MLYMVNPPDMLYMLGMAKQTKYPVRKLSYFSEDMAKAIDDFRYAHRIPSENEAIRQLIHTGLAARPILAEVQSMLLHLTRNNPDPDIERYIEAIHKALNPKDD